MTPAEVHLLREGARRFGVELDPDAMDRLDRYFAILDVWRSQIRLIPERDRRFVVERHALDSLAPVSLLPDRGRIVDVGSGAGFPGIILGCVRPDLELLLVDSRRKRVAFLREAIRAIGLPAARALEMRAETGGRSPGLAGSASIVAARGVRLDVFLGLAVPFLASDGRVIAMQTPATATRADRVAAVHQLRLVRREDYELPDGAIHSVLVFARGAVTIPVS